MDDIIRWLCDNWIVWIPCLFGIVEFLVLLIFKKRPKIIDPTIYPDVIQYIQEAETVYGSGHGKEKLLFVCKKLAEMRGMSDVAAMVCYRSFIENVLNTPQKKGGK